MDAIWAAAAAAIPTAAGVAAVLLTRMRSERKTAGLERALGEARLLLEEERKRFEEREKAVEQNVRRAAMDEFLAEMRVEERHYIRQHRVLFAQRRSLVMQERIFFRNIPLSSWVEHEVPLEEGASVDDVARTLGVFQKALELEARDERPRRLLFG